MLVSFLLLLIGLFLMILSIFVKHEIVRLFLAPIGAIFFVGAVVFGFETRLSLLSQLVLYLIFAVIAYIIWNFISKKYSQAHRYTCLALCGLFSLAYAVFILPMVIGYLFPSEEQKSFNSINEKLRPLLDEQQALLNTDQLSEQQKQRYTDLAKEIDALNEAWQKEYFSSFQDSVTGD